jgi:hypothetical protein
MPTKCSNPLMQFPWHFRNASYPSASSFAKENKVKKKRIDPILPNQGGSDALTNDNEVVVG